MAGEMMASTRPDRPPGAEDPPPGLEWPPDLATLEAQQSIVAALTPPPWVPPGQRPLAVAGVFVCFGPSAPPGVSGAGEAAWAAAAVVTRGRVVAQSEVVGQAAAPYVPGLLAAREGDLLARSLAGLDEAPDVVLVNATGRDHPRRGGLAIHLGAILRVPTVGVTNRTLVASPLVPGPLRGDAVGLLHDGEVVAAALRSVDRRRPLVVHPGWRTELPVAIGVVLSATDGRARTPRPVRAARQLAREARAVAEGRTRRGSPLLARDAPGAPWWRRHW